MAPKQTKTDEKTGTKTETKTGNKDEVSTSDEKQKTEVVKEETVRYQALRATVGTLISLLFMAIVGSVVYDDTHFNLNLPGKVNAFQLSSYWHKLEFVLCYQIIGVSWLYLNMLYVISKRATTPAFNPMSGHEDITELARNVMTNSVEQFLMSSFAQIISISFIEVNVLIKIIPLINFLFLIGRITFWLGYPKYRTFGFMCTFIPNTLLINYNLYKFIQNLFF